MTHPFPIDRIQEIQAQPDNFMLIENVPLTRPDGVPARFVDAAIPDERPFVFLDVETTGLDGSADKIIELGLVRGTYSPSQGVITSVERSASFFEDPLVPISDEIQAITGITNEMVAGHRIKDEMLEKEGWFEGDPLIIAHNASFDRAFFDARFPQYSHLGWACSYTEIPWKEMGFGTAKLDYLVYRHGYFYQSHRAEADCLATVWLLHVNEEAARTLIAASSTITVNVLAYGSPFDVKDRLKEAGYRWHAGDSGSNKCWWRRVPLHDLPAEQAFLDQTYYNGASMAHYQQQDARQRFTTIPE